MRDETFDRGAWRDFCLYSILRREWKEPKMLAKTA
jgi:RimJ/RimL family protein N-acetyltransferase